MSRASKEGDSMAISLAYSQSVKSSEASTPAEKTGAATHVAMKVRAALSIFIFLL